MRIDVYLFENGFCVSRSRARELIKSGFVRMGERTILKPSEEYDGKEISIISDIPYVSRGGIKLKAAIDHFKIDCRGVTAIDIGASTGGFTDCLLCEGAKKVFCVDSGAGQLSSALLCDDRVTSFEHINARYMTKKLVGEDQNIDLCVMDVSFISQTLIYDAISGILKKGGMLISLIKPQFEVGRDRIGKGGIVKDEKSRQYAIDKVKGEAEKRGFRCLGVIDSPISGGDGNKEFLAAFLNEPEDIRKDGIAELKSEYE